MTKTTDRLTHVEELELVKEYQATGNKRVLDRIVTTNLGLVHKLTNKFPIKNCVCTYEDLFQEGVAGLIHAIGKFDPTKGCRLSTYSYNWINAYIRRYYMNHSRAVRVPVHIADAQLTLNKQVETLTSSLGRTPTMSEVVELNPNAATILGKMQSNVSLNVTIGDDSELEDLQGDDRTEENDLKFDCDLLLSKLRKQVSPRDFNILLMRYGLGGYAEHTLQEVGDKYELTRARCHQIERRLLHTMRELV